MPDAVQEYINSANNNTQPLGVGGVDPKVIGKQIEANVKEIGKSINVALNTVKSISETSTNALDEAEKLQQEYLTALKFYDDQHKKDMIDRYRKDKKDLEEQEARDKELKQKQEELDKSRVEQIDNSLEQNVEFDHLAQPIPDDKNKKEKTFFEKFDSYIKILPNRIPQAKKQEDGEQLNLGGEKIPRVSFHPEGIKILRTLLDPIYKSLGSFTKTMDDDLKIIIDKMKNVFDGKKYGGIMRDLLRIISDVLFVSEAIAGIFSFISGAITRLSSAFVDMFENLLKGAYEYAKAYKRFLYDEPIKLLKKMGLDVEKIVVDAYEGIVARLKNIGKFLKFDEMANGVVDIFNIIMNSFKEFKLPEVLENRFIKPLTNFVQNIGRIGKSLETFFEPLLRPFKALFNFFKGGEGTVSAFGRFISWFGRIGELSRSFVGPLQSILRFLMPLFNILKPFVGLIEGIARVLSIEVIAVVMGFVDAIRTFFDVWKDDKLSFFQKAVSVFAGFVGGVGSMASDLVKTLGGILQFLGKFIPGLKMAGDAVNSFGELINTHDLGKNVANLFRDKNKLDSEKGKEKDAWKSGERYKNASPEERKRMEQQHEELERKNQQVVPPNISNNRQVKPDIQKTEESQVVPAAPEESKPEIVQEKPVPEPVYQPEAPATINLKPIQQNNQAQEEQNKINLQIANSLSMLTKYMQNMNQSPTIINNSTSTTTAPQNNKEYLFKPIFDTNSDKRADWWKMSNVYNPNR